MSVRQQLYPRRIIFHCDDETLEEISKYAQQERVTRADAIRRLLRKGLEAER